MTREQAIAILWDDTLHSWALLRKARQAAPDVARKVDENIDQWIEKAEQWARDRERERN